MATPESRFTVERGGACSFCGKPARNVRTLLQARGSSVRICDECIQVCVDVGDEPPRGTSPSLDPNGNPPATAFRCSFCGYAKSDTNKLISGPRVFICSYCVDDAVELSPLA